MTEPVSFILKPSVAPFVYRSPDGLYCRDFSAESANGEHGRITFDCTAQEWRDYLSRDERFELAAAQASAKSAPAAAATLILLLALLLGAALDAGAATLGWSDNANNELGFVVRRRLSQFQPGTTQVVNPGAFAVLIQLPGADRQTYSDATAVADINYDNEYCYMVDAYNLDAAGIVQESGHSNTACLVIPRVNPPVALPARPGNLTITP